MVKPIIKDNTSPAKRKLKVKEPNLTKKKQPIKKVKLISGLVNDYSTPGSVYSCGQGDMGQLGLGADIMEKSKPYRISDFPENIVQVCAGGMHNICLDTSGEVFTFGCNDDSALGRITLDDDEATIPKKVAGINSKVVQVSAGDSHSAALTEDGHVYLWGTFRDSSGLLGILEGVERHKTPVRILKDMKIIKISSGCDHLVCLTEEGVIYSLGSCEFGQLGRVGIWFLDRGGRRGINYILNPGKIETKRKLYFCDIWTGNYNTFAKEKSGKIYAWGLNNYYQLGVGDMNNRLAPEKSIEFDPTLDWQEISAADHHILARDAQGHVYSMGRYDYGRLGHGSTNQGEKQQLTKIESLRQIKVNYINCNSGVSFAISNNGTVYGWGMGSNDQLGQGEEEDLYEPKNVKLPASSTGLMVSAGAQHTLFLLAGGPVNKDNKKVKK